MALFQLPMTPLRSRPLCTTSEAVRSHGTEQFDCFRCLWRLRHSLLQNVSAYHIKDMINVVSISGARLHETDTQLLSQLQPFFARDHPLRREITFIAYKKCDSSRLCIFPDFFYPTSHMLK